MTYIQPNSTVDLYSNMPLDPQYNDTVYFSDRDAQTSYFDTSKHRIQRLSDVSYVRKGRQTIRFTPNNWTQVMQCNYLRFKNTSFENQWFYAFVISCEYINNNTAEITFMIDVMQTWFFGRNSQIGIKPSFVIRQHDANDGIGNNIEPEPVELNEYVSSGQLAHVAFNQIGFVVAIVDTNQQTSGGLSGGVYSGATLFYYENTNNINNKINEYLQHPDSVLAVYTIPKLDNVADGTNITNMQGMRVDVTVTGVTAGEALDGYVPHNNKCYTYPYNFLRIFTFEGNYADFRYEFFEGGSAPFYAVCSIVQPVKSVVMARNYKQSGHGNGQPYATEGVSITSYPVCSWNSDTYAAWVAQNSVPMNNLTKAQEDKIAVKTNATRANESLTGIGGIASMLGAIADWKLGSGISAGVNALLSMIGQENMMRAGNKVSNIDFNTSMQNAKYSASVQADTIHGSIGSGNSTLAMGKPGFYAVRMYQPARVMRKVDSYFDMYGYAVNRLTTPNLHARPHWSYCRVSDIQLTNQLMPADALGQIKGIFENGIRFWNSMDEVGNFNLDNRAPH